MRRAAVRAFRTTCQHTVRGLSSRSNGYVHTRRSALLSVLSATANNSPKTKHSFGNKGLTPAYSRYLSTSSPTQLPFRSPPPPHLPLSSTPHAAPLQSSMHIRRLSAALVSGLVGYGAYYAYQGEGSNQTQAAAPFSTKSTAPSDSAMTGTSSAAAATRNVLVIGANELSTGTLTGDAPLSKYADDAGRRVIEMLNTDQVTERLRQNEESYGINRGQGVLRYDLVQLASNYPIEDDHAEKIVEVPAKNGSNSTGPSDWMFWGVFDGHSGWTTSAKLRQTLIKYVANELNETFKTAPADASPPAEAIDGAIKTAFTRLDDDIVQRSAETVLAQQSKTVAAEILTPALSGSCALLSFYDSTSKLLRVACTGDSRAVLGRRGPSGKWTATPLSVDQTGSNPDEEARIRALHPGEQHVIRNGRVLGGLEPSRAFGDASYKWTRDVAERLGRSFFVRQQSSLLRTPPYVTAEPVVTTTKIEPENGDFIVMATDGLWEMLTNEEAVGLVGKWLEQQKAAAAAGNGSSFTSNLFGKKGNNGAADLPVEAAGPEAGKHGERAPIRLRQWGISPDDNDRFVVKDKNAATHLVRNALGGRNEEQVSALLTLPAPFSRRYRDDLTVQVIFFGGGEASGGGNGGVEVNQEATGPGHSPVPKAKL
ncbi:protein phosphatase 2c [Ophiostoma piceae UAMH 11346]|uniref:Protein phosphatase 2c n=1 Tax=Ophiostoma piceae (strain UAMH 11346) TaxID=1262450 RepID=S3C1L1_OPHP1|nr:protein phosphatase 2c [Ophiostoma piceae UAMH 11346]